MPKSTLPLQLDCLANSLTPEPESRWKQHARPSVVSALRHPVQQKPLFSHARSFHSISLCNRLPFLRCDDHGQ